MFRNALLTSNRKCAVPTKKSRFLRAAATQSLTVHNLSMGSSSNSPGGAPASNSFVMNLFLGKTEVRQVMPYPNSLTEEQRETVAELVDPFTRFMDEVNDPAANDQLAEVQPDTLQGLKEMGAFGLQVPTDFDGLGLTNTQYARLVEIVGRNDLGVGIALGAHQSIGFKGILLRGTQQQKEKYLPKLATGEQFAAFCLTEPTSGSDAASIQTRAVKSDCGKFYRLSGGKIWISNGGIADVFTVFAKTKVTQEDGTEKDKVSAFVVERAFGGITSGPPENKMGIKASNTAEVHFDDVPVPVENILGKEGDGFKVAMHILNNGRFGMCAALSGTMKAMIEKATDHVTNRVQFGAKLHTFGGVKEKLARMSTLAYVTESMAYVICANMDAGYQDFQLEAAISKIFASEAAWTVADECLQILGGMGYMKDCGVERVVRDLRIFRIFEGTNDILRFFIALTGMQHYGKSMAPVAAALKSPVANLPTLLGYGTSRAARTVKTAFGSVDQTVVTHAHRSVKQSARSLAHCIAYFGSTVEALAARHGRKFVPMQTHQTILADCAIDIFAMAAVVSRASRSHELDVASREHETAMCELWCSEAAMRVGIGLKRLCDGSLKDQVKGMAQISDALVDTQAVLPVHPLGF